MTKNVNIKITADSSQANAALNSTGGALKNLDRTASTTSRSVGGSLGGLQTKAVAVGSAIGSAIGIVASKAFEGISSQMDGAIKRMDTINNFPKVMQNFGEGADESRKAMSRLVDGVRGLPTSLDSITNLAQAFTPMTHDIGDATTLALAFNNAILAGGASAEIQSASFEQFRQALAKGKPELQDWKTIASAMPAQLQQIGRYLGLGTGQLSAYQNNAIGLYNAMTDGKLSLNDFANALVQLNQNGANGFPSFANQAKNAIGGVGTQITVLKQTIQQGMVDIMNAIGTANIAAFFTFVGDVIKAVTYNAIIFIQIMIGVFNTINRIASAIGGFFGGLFGGSGGKATTQAKQTQASTGATAKNMGGAAKAAGGVADGLGDANKEAKKLTSQLAGFDEMNTLKKDSGAGGTTSGSGVNGIDLDTSGLDVGAIDGAATGLDKLREAIDKMSPAAKIIGGVISALLGLAGIKGIAKLAGWTWDFVKSVGALFAPLGKLAIVQKIGAWFGKLGGWLLRLGPWIWGLIGGWEGLVAGIVGAIRAIALVVQKFGVIGAIIGTVVLALIWLVTNWQDVVTWVQNAAGAIGTFFAGLATWVATGVAAIGAFFVQIGTAIGTFFTGIFTAVANFFAPILAVFTQIVQTIGQIFYSVIVLVVAVFAIILEFIFNNVVKPIADAFVGLWEGIIATAQIVWNGIVAVFTTIINWINNTIIKPLAAFFVNLWNGIVTTAQAVWNGIVKVFTPIVAWVNQNIISPVRNFFVGLWNNIVSGVQGFISTFKSILGTIGSWVNNNVIKPVKDFFSGLWSGIKTGAQALVNGFKTVFGTIGGVIKAPINGIIDAINGVIDGMNKIKVPDWVPGLGGKSPNFPKIPRLATGGIIDRPTLAVVGEAGREAVMPLEHNTGWIDNLAGMLASKGGVSSTGQPIALTVKIGETTIASKMVELINDRTMMSGRNQIRV